ncbi:WD40 repeat domain-containing protein [Actinomadura sp. 9N215]|uniref:WD40 repeat domain-containing protein n=1 Tax=Actinomadura sp. 9N215 TaxID=3375150 RepID=UPI0037A84D9C
MDLRSIEACDSASGRPRLSDADRRQLLYLDAVRRGAAVAADDLAGAGPGAALWRADWATGTDLDPRLLLKLHVGPVMSVAWGEIGERPLVAVGTREQDEALGGARYRLRVWDVLSLRSRDLPCAEPVRCLAFAVTEEGPVLVSGHDGGRLRIWDVADASLRKAVETGGDDLHDLYVVDDQYGAESDRRTPMVTLDARGRVRLWSLPTGEQAGELDAPVAYTIRGGRLADGRRVLLTGGHGLSLWDLDGGGRLPLPVPQESRRVRDVVLFTSDGRDRAVIISDYISISAYDLATGARLSDPIDAHVNRSPDGLMRVWSDPGPSVKLAAVSGTLAVPTPQRVHLWDLETSQQRHPPLVGPVACSTVQTVRWQDRDLLLTGSSYDGVVALWNLDRPVTRAPGHGRHINGVTLAGTAGVVVSADEGGTLVARHAVSGRPVTAPLATGVERTRGLAAWADGREIFAATGAGSRYVPDGRLRRWNMTAGVQHGRPVQTHGTYLHCLARVRVGGDDVLVTFGPDRMFKLWRPADGALLAETMTGLSAMVTGFATGADGGRPLAAVSTYGRPMTLHALDDLTLTPIIIPEAGDDIVLDVAGPHVVAGHAVHERGGPTTVRVWNVSGGRFGADVRGPAEVTSAAVRAWPTAYIGRADGTVSLTDLETGGDLCPPVLLPSRPNAMTVTGDGDLIVGFGADLARLRPPAA